MSSSESFKIISVDLSDNVTYHKTKRFRNGNIWKMMEFNIKDVIYINAPSLIHLGNVIDNIKRIKDRAIEDKLATNKIKHAFKLYDLAKAITKKFHYRLIDEIKNTKFREKLRLEISFDYEVYESHDGNTSDSSTLTSIKRFKTFKSFTYYSLIDNKDKLLNHIFVRLYHYFSNYHGFETNEKRKLRYFAESLETELQESVTEASMYLLEAFIPTYISFTILPPNKIQKYIPTPKHLSRSSVINPANECNLCVLYCILIHITKDKIRNKYSKNIPTNKMFTINNILKTYAEMNNIDLGCKLITKKTFESVKDKVFLHLLDNDITYYNKIKQKGIDINELDEIALRFDKCIKVFDENKDMIYSVRDSTDLDLINLLLVQRRVSTGNFRVEKHISYIEDIQTFKFDPKKKGNKYCAKCNRYYKSVNIKPDNIHLTNRCRNKEFNITNLVFPTKEDNKVEFENYHHKEIMDWLVHFDFEAAQVKTDSNNNLIAINKPVTVATYLQCTKAKHPMFKKYFDKSPDGTNSFSANAPDRVDYITHEDPKELIKLLLQKLNDYYEYAMSHYKDFDYKDRIRLKQFRDNLKSSDRNFNCYFCNLLLDPDNYDVHHCHLTGHIYGPTHPHCNRKAKKQNKLIVYGFNNVKYDNKLITEYLDIDETFTKKLKTNDDILKEIGKRSLKVINNEKKQIEMELKDDNNSDEYKKYLRDQLKYLKEEKKEVENIEIVFKTDNVFVNNKITEEKKLLGKYKDDNIITNIICKSSNNFMKLGFNNFEFRDIQDLRKGSLEEFVNELKNETLDKYLKPYLKQTMEIFNTALNNTEQQTEYIINKNVYRLKEEYDAGKLSETKFKSALESNVKTFIEQNIDKLNYINKTEYYEATLPNFPYSYEFVKNEYPDLSDDKISKLITRKGIYPYNFLDSYDKLSLSLNVEKADCISLENFNNNQKDKDEFYEVYKLLNCKTFGDYTRFYNLLDVHQSCDFLTKFRNDFYNAFELELCHYISSPSCAKDIMLKLYKEDTIDDESRDVLELLTDREMYDVFRKGMTGGISVAFNRSYDRAKCSFSANAPDRSKCKCDKINKCWNCGQTLLMDINGMYSSIMRNFKLPFCNFEFVDPSKISLQTIIDTPDDSDIGYTIELDLPAIDPKFHDYLNDYPLYPMKRKCKYSPVFTEGMTEKEIEKMNKAEVPKLVLSLEEQKDYVVDYRFLKTILSVKFNGEKCIDIDKIKVKRIIKYKQVNFMRSFIIKLTEMRRIYKEAGSEAEKIIKLIMNAVYGKMLENVEKFLRSELCWNEEDLNKLLENVRYKNSLLLNEKLILVNLNKRTIKASSPIQVGFSILQLSKTIMIDYIYHSLKPVFGDRFRSMYTDTDSLMFNCKSDNIIAELEQAKELHKYDISNLDPDVYKDILERNKEILKENKGKPGYFGFDSPKPVEYLYCLGSKVYTYSYDNKVSNRGKGIPTNELKKLNKEAYMLSAKDEPIKGEYKQMIYDKKLKSMVWKNQTKIMLNFKYNKVYVCPNDQITNDMNYLAWGHYKIPKEYLVYSNS